MDQAHGWTEQELQRLERRISRVYREAWDDLEKTVIDYFERFQERDEQMKNLIGTVQNGKEWTEHDYQQWRLNQIGRGERFDDLAVRVAERYTKANETAIAYVNDDTPSIYSLNRNYAAYTIEQVAGDVGFTLWDEQTVKRLIVEEPDLMPYYPPEKAVKRGIDLAYGKKQITASVTSSILQGRSIKEIADDLQNRISDMNRTSAVRAARTAVTGAENAGRMDSYVSAERMGIKLRKEWLATLDNRTRHAHAVLDGQKADIDKPFKVDGQEIRYPGDPTAAGYLVYNCRCTLIADVDNADTSDAKRWARNPETGRPMKIENMTYAQWAWWKGKTGAVAASPKFSIMSQEKAGSGGGGHVQTIGRIDIEKYKVVSTEIKTADVIITDERIKHIQERHPNDFERYSQYLKRIVEAPDYILEANKPNTAFLLKEFTEAGEQFQLILRLAVEGDRPGYKNSIITFLRVEEKRYRRYLRTKKILYKSE